MKYSTELFSVTVPGGGPRTGLPWRPALHARALPGSTNFVGTNAQAHLFRVLSFLRADSQRGAASLTIACRKRGQVV